MKMKLNLFSLLVEGLLKEHTLTSLGILNEAWFRLNEYFVKREKNMAKDSIRKSEISKEQSNDTIGIFVINRDESKYNNIWIGITKSA